MAGIIDFFKGSFEEFKNHVTWPEWAELQSSTVVIAVTTLILSIFLYVVDFSFQNGLENLYALLKSI